MPCKIYKIEIENLPEEWARSESMGIGIMVKEIMKKKTRNETKREENETTEFKSTNKYNWR